MTAWQHLRITINPRRDSVQAVLDSHGAAGWELVTAFGPRSQYSDDETYVFKRPAQGATE